MNPFRIEFFAGMSHRGAAHSEESTASRTPVPLAGSRRAKLALGGWGWGSRGHGACGSPPSLTLSLTLPHKGGGNRDSDLFALVAIKPLSPSVPATQMSCLRPPDAFAAAPAPARDR